MGTITKIERQKKNKNRVSVFVDGEYFGSLDEKTLLESGFKAGDELQEQLWRKYQVQSEYQSAFNKGIKYISKLMRSEKQVKDYLAGKGYDEPATVYAIEKMKEYKYIDDEAFAKMILSHQINVKRIGISAAKDTMWKNGIPNDISEKTLLDYDEETQFDNAKKQYEKLMAKYKNETDELKKRQKIAQAMARRGFDWDMIKKASRFYEGIS